MIQKIKGLSFFQSLLLILTGSTLFMTAAVSLSYYFFSRQSYINHATGHLVYEFRSITDNFNFHFNEDLKNTLRLLSTNDIFRQVNLDAPRNNKISYPPLEKLLTRYLLSKKTFLSLYCVDGRGREIARVDRSGVLKNYRDFSKSELFNKLNADSDGFAVAGPFKNKNTTYFTIAAHKSGGRDTGGFIAIDYDLKYFFEYLSGIKIYQEQLVWAYGPDNANFYAPRGSSASAEISSAFSKEFQKSLIFKTLDNSIIAYSDYSLVPDKPFLRVAAKVPFAVIFKDTRSMGHFYLLIFTASAVISILIAFALSRKFSRPIIKLAAASKNLASGNLAATVDSSTGGEIGMLVENFNKMSAELKNTTVSRDYVDNILHSIADMIFVIDINSVIKTTNYAAMAALEYSESELTGLSINTIFEDGEKTRKEFFTRLSTDGFLSDMELNFRTKTGKLLPVMLSSSLLKRKEGNVDLDSIILIAKDITARKAMLAAFLAEKEHLAVTLRSIADGVISVDSAGRISLMNKVAEDLTGWSFASSIGRHIAEVLHIICKDSREPCENLYVRVLNSGTVTDMPGETILIARDGAERNITYSGAPIKDNEGRITGVVIVFRDITEKLKMEENITKAHKIEAVGILAGGIAHDFNNLLTAILGNIGLAKFHAAPDSVLFDLLSESEKASFEARGLTQQLMTFSKGGVPVKQKASIVSILRDSATFMLRGSKSRCDYFIEDSLWDADMDVGQMAQVINNIIINADQSMPDGGAIEISARNIRIYSAENSMALAPGNYIHIAIRDHGNGIEKSIISKIFYPYFTTKETGSGLGLAVSFSIINKHGGFIGAESEVGVGTTINIYLPAVTAKTAKTQEYPAATEQREIKGHGKVLIMDDEDLIRNTMGRILNHLGYSAGFARNGEEAISVFSEARNSGQPFDAVILDLTIPGGFGGKDVLAKMLKMDPSVKALVFSGYSNDPIVANFKEYGFSGVLPKPCKIEDMSKALFNILGATSL
ncbi:MAG TPA: hypothetical protein DEE98_05440 [Elusimicrobia bacterium]|nr:MAG: hypothetical protein A2278_04025 [Elusimicrobia bacterium RIFOXYA12_FULL_49_49]OGS10662.1 MAG: hypothetical protein A2386_07630 [Elusimicrobia bacterium RIFOXYB1_FULL_48_9]OGS15326.1 MAG: hypothetical protein A2251_07340 [Elusimicrobia bacterium RIFOXYA2_FULL_47_53]OGS26456.1 MAG: hypothetical protein A2339_01675 [Elusimicrobia bacterium RIFOXYB12_FULL_50_12]OGS30581.1 MAG: hypothetical protein A2323_02460 [Elusimicrobia bacterium RIFOXYB2_FULL_46_23]HBU69810.1 hypothetical protein [El